MAHALVTWDGPAGTYNDYQAPPKLGNWPTIALKVHIKKRGNGTQLQRWLATMYPSLMYLSPPSEMQYETDLMTNLCINHNLTS